MKLHNEALYNYAQLVGGQITKTIYEMLQTTIAALRVCPTCKNTYIANRTDQLYCSQVCAVPAKREAKRNWWRTHKGRSLVLPAVEKEIS